MKYFYPQVSGGYRWNMLQRILNTIGIEPVGSGDLSDATGIWQTYLDFSRDLTTVERTQLDMIMAGNPTQPPIPAGSRFVIRDVWNDRDAIGISMGFPYRVYYSESVPGSGNINQVELHFDQILNTTQKNKIISEYSKLILLK